MKLDLKTKILATYVLVVVMGLLLSGLVYWQGRQVVAASEALVAQDVPALRQLSTLKLTVLEQESIAYEYYATTNRAHFLRRYATSDSLCQTGLNALRLMPDMPSVSLQTFDTQLATLRRLNTHLDHTLQLAVIDWDQARRDVAAIGDETRRINQELDQLMRTVEARVVGSGLHTQQTVRRVSGIVIFFSLTLFGVALFVGYYIHAYLSEQTERRKLAMFPERNPAPVLRLNREGQVIYANPSTRSLLQALKLPADKAQQLLPPNMPEHLRALRQNGVNSECWEYTLDRHTLEIRTDWLGDLDVYHVYLADISERKTAERNLVHQAYHDALTGLPNRRMFQEQITQNLNDTHHESVRAAVFLLGLDRFKVVIGSLGHEVGDQLLVAVAERWRKIIDASSYRNGAALYRFEGDLFSILMPGFNSGQTPVLLAEQLKSSMRLPFHVSGRELFLTASIGISIYPLDGLDAVTLLKNADTAMQRVKHEGGNALECYTRDMNAMALEWLSLENYLRHSLESDELRLYYQPQVDIRSGRMIGMESLIRWQHPERGLLSPAHFISIAEESGLILPIGEWILRTACVQNKRWQDQGLPHMIVAVNISARQFHGQDLPQLVRSILAETGLPPDTLELEVTEGIAMQNVERTTAILHELKAMGIKLSIDDFGTGFSSLSYLKRFPIDKLKVDQSFIRHLTEDENDAAITQAVITLGHSLKLQVIAEGVETPEQLAWLREYACDEIQGYLYSKPVPAAALEELLRENKTI